MKNSKRIASLLLAALVSTSAVPAFADDAETTEENYGIELISLDEDSVAEDGTAPSASENVSSVDVKTANLGEVIADEENWVANSTNEITF